MRNISAATALPLILAGNDRNRVAALICAASGVPREASMVIADSVTATGIVRGLLASAGWARENNGFGTVAGRSF
ncbi:hypothetical protein [Mesorhizobium sp. M1295]|uniref:hypothetical protein n=1 Tax=unclassified Mesorhizobium TaxID=325217 RepID=UPI003339B7D3